ncbi:ARL14 effector protein [Odontomachus brunneus]|uniref:ARL14 effector protein n=1 Tax=Odontomachus brunneus TaxID=486640 RepID=UPI0013F1F217|nr:ARL14 effector protein [Odontomachus brunneus]
MNANSSTSENASQPNAERNPPRNEKKTRGSRQKAVDNLSKKFLRNFDPEHSEREKRKLYRRLYHGHKRQLYDEKGIYIQTADDLCDCLNLDCYGCHYPCAKCSSPKCGHECRNNRKWTYDSIHCEGADLVIKNPLAKES